MVAQILTRVPPWISTPSVLHRHHTDVCSTLFRVINDGVISGKSDVILKPPKLRAMLPTTLEVDSVTWLYVYTTLTGAEDLYTICDLTNDIIN